MQTTGMANRKINNNNKVEKGDNCKSYFQIYLLNMNVCVSASISDDKPN